MDLVILLGCAIDNGWPNWTTWHKATGRNSEDDTAADDNDDSTDNIQPMHNANTKQWYVYCLLKVMFVLMVGDE